MEPQPNKLLQPTPSTQPHARPDLAPEDAALWNRVLEAGVKAQGLVPGAVAVGGTAAALYAGHRVSVDTDHLVSGLKDRFDDVLERRAGASEWRTARTSRPVLILGSIAEVEVGFREPRRQTAIETTAIETPAGTIVVPTLPEMIAIKAFLAYSRNAVRDYLDFAALSACLAEDRVLEVLLKLDDLYRGLQTASVGLEVAKALAGARPFDLESTDLSRYKALAAEWHDWRRTEQICRRFGLLLGQRLVDGEPT
jgi:hypothetical protein